MKALSDLAMKILATPYGGWILAAIAALAFLALVAILCVAGYLLVGQGRGVSWGKLKIDAKAAQTFTIDGQREQARYSKLLYIKVLHMRRRGSGQPPMYLRKLSEIGSPEIEVFDEAIYYSLHIFVKPQRKFGWSVRSSGKVDPFIAHPWTDQILYPDQKERLLQNLLTPTCREKSNVYLAVSHFYNGLQPGDEDFTLRVEDDIDYARIVVDFSSLADPKPRFVELPKAFLVTKEGEQIIGIAECRPGIFTAVQLGIKEWQALKIAFRTADD